MFYCQVDKQTLFHSLYLQQYMYKKLHRNNGVINLSTHQKQTTNTSKTLLIFCISKNVHIVLESLSVTKLLKLTYCCFSLAKYPSKILFFENLGFWAPLVKRFKTLSSTAPMRSHWTFWRRPLSGATLLQLPPILLVRELSCSALPKCLCKFYIIKNCY